MHGHERIRRFSLSWDYIQVNFPSGYPQIILVHHRIEQSFLIKTVGILSFTGMKQLSIKDRLNEAKIEARKAMTDILADFHIDNLTDDLRQISFLRLNPIIAINEPFDSNYFRVIFE